LTNQRSIYDLIASFAGQGNIKTIALPFIDFMGSIEGGLFLSQLLYWSDKGKSHYGWFYKTYKDWWEDIRLNEYQVRKSIKKCEEMGFLKTKVKKANGNPTLHYRVDLKAFIHRFLSFHRIDPLKIAGTSNIDYISDYHSKMNQAQDQATKQDVINSSLTWTEDMQEH